MSGAGQSETFASSSAAEQHGSIVVGLTDKPVSNRLLTWAAQRALDLKQPLRLVSVLDDDTGSHAETALVNEILEAMRERAGREAHRLRNHGLEVIFTIGRGDPTEVLLEAASSAGLLVVGSDTRRPYSNIVRGVRGMRLASAAPCPVVIVPDFDMEESSGVLVGVDGSLTSRRALAWAASEASRLGEALTAVSAWEPLPLPRHVHAYPKGYLTNMQRDAEETLSSALIELRRKHPDLTIEDRVTRGHASTVINEAAARARMVVVGTHGREGFKRFMLGSVSHEVIAHLATVTAVVR